MICSIAVPSSPEPAWPVRTSTAGSSPAACEAASSRRRPRARTASSRRRVTRLVAPRGVGGVRAVALGGDADERRGALQRGLDARPALVLALALRPDGRCGSRRRRRRARRRSSPRPCVSLRSGTPARTSPVRGEA